MFSELTINQVFIPLTNEAVGYIMFLPPLEGQSVVFRYFLAGVHQVRGSLEEGCRPEEGMETRHS